MPFGYFGAKHALARHYPVPRHDIIIEPFAGSAGYSLHHATPAHRVILIEKDERVVDLWRRIQRMDLEELRTIECPPVGEICTDPLVNLTQQSASSLRPGKYTRATVTTRQARDWPKIRRRIARHLDRVRTWEVHHGDYSTAPALEATYFVDPPYWTDRPESRGAGYRVGASDLDYPALGEWCRTRPGFVIACEQAGAQWLPFRGFATRRTNARAASAGTRLEVIWTSEHDDELLLDF